jgi:mannose-1-phosphate guanylyltransferase
MADQPHWHALIPAGGSGTRLWPLSRSDRPKFLLDLTGAGRSLIQTTRDRLDAVVPPSRTMVITGSAHAADVARQLPEVPADNIVVEPAPRNTAPAIGLAAALLHRRDPDAVMGSFHADHLIADTAAFTEALRAAYTAADDGRLVTVGIAPTAPETGFGYIRRGDAVGPGVFAVEEFVEKPAREVAERYLAAGSYLWNAGIFVWRADVFLAELRRQLPDLHAAVQEIADAWGSPRQDEVLGAVWSGVAPDNVDQGVLEGAAQAGLVATVPADIGWNDVGDWDTLAGLLPSDDGVAHLGGGTVLARDCAGTLVCSTSGRLVAGVGLRDLVVIDTPDALLVAPRDRAQQVKAVVDTLREQGRDELV